MEQDLVARAKSGDSVSPSGLGESAGIVAVDNEFIDNVTGIFLAETASRLESNHFRGNGTAIRVAGGGPTIEGNTIEENELGLELEGESLPRLTGNHLCGNGQDLVVDTAVNPTTLEGNEVCPS